MSPFIARPEHGVVWITGASSGIGRALALKLAEEGYKVAVTARSHEMLLALQAEASALAGSIVVLDGDVTNSEDMEHTVAAIEYQHGPVALVVLNAGIYLPARGEDLNHEVFERSFAVNLHGVVNCLVPAVRHMRARGYGQIAFVSSLAGYSGLPGTAAYGASKAAIINMAESLKFELDRMGIHVQLVTPGYVDTPLTAQNTFKMPDMVSAQQAADAIAAGLKSSTFDISFPKRMVYRAKLMRFLPYSLYFRVLRYFLRSGRKRRAVGTPVTPHPAE
ncbi:SDR family oxidoreductase [Rhizobium lusitanum]|uniref:NAD(P)-dependent dehydrogenase (Short-subunit alcohol dehydrogenase family) n=1 Tax=Rhizobium lusitanum TaxID=293958 RepID=A0A7X0IN57_9HYPH|nr:SDR family NAD(P)-dependent oxidoreductase [Rhizobium lusitanum]MBB6483598.1 NAD(P)-dependent dehydrogenase (short-subunit alcohol dehydrogenase family) [Rhizobium lusitanum]